MVVLTVSLFGTMVSAQAPANHRIQGTVHSRVQHAQDIGVAEPSMLLGNMQLNFATSPEQQAALDQLLSDQQNSSSSSYHRWLTPEDFGKRFGVSQEDEVKVATWLSSQGFTDIHMARGRTYISFSGTAGLAENAFQTRIHRVREADGESHYTNTTDVSVPPSLAHVVRGVRGLNDFRLKPPRHELWPRYTNGQNVGNNQLLQTMAPGDIGTIYGMNALYASGIDGTGVTIAVAGGSDINLDSIASYKAAFGLPATLPTVLLVPGTDDPGFIRDNEIEGEADLEIVSAVARDANVIYVNSNSTALALQYIVDEGLASVVSISYGGTEALYDAQYYRAIAQQASAEGITIVAASGDTGPSGGDWVDPSASAATYGLLVGFPASVPEIVAVGGTDWISAASFADTNGAYGGTATGYVPEKVWNSGLQAASGGGVSKIFSKPAWQSGIGVPDDGMRDVPDVAFYSGDVLGGYLVCVLNACTPYYIGQFAGLGGTSLSAPLFAGIVALINDYLVKNGKITRPGLGNINPALYSMATHTTDVFHDVTAGDNIVPCGIGTPDCTTGSYGYSAGPGYDLATGWGSVDAANLAREWPVTALGSTVTEITASSTAEAASALPNIDFTATVKDSSGQLIKSGTVSFMAMPPSGTGAGVVVPFGTADLSAGNPAVVSSQAFYTGYPGVYTIKVVYNGTTALAASISAPVSVAVLSQVQTQTILTQITQGEATTTGLGPAYHYTLSAQVFAPTVSAQPTGNINFLSGSNVLAAAPISNGTATATVTLYSGTTYQISASYPATGSFLTSTSSAQSVNAFMPIATSVIVTGSPVSAAEGESVTLTATVKAVSGSAISDGSVTFSYGSTVLGTATLVSGVASMKTLSLPQGTDSVTASYDGSANFIASTGQTTLTITPPDFTLSAQPTAITVQGGQDANTTLTLTPRGSFSRSLTFSCSGLPSGASCTFGAPVVQPNGTSTVALAITTAAGVAVHSANRQVYWAVVPIAWILILRHRKIGAGLFSLCIITLLAGCGSSSTNAQQRSSNGATNSISVTAKTVNGINHTTNITLTVM